MNHGCTIVISPLLALIEDQVNALRAKNVRASFLSHNQTPQEKNAVYDDLSRGHPKTRLLYVSPETFVREKFRKYLKIMVRQRELNRLVVDEAHCCVEWGQDLRRDYGKLGFFRQEYPHIPVTAVTASAPPRLRVGILSLLNLGGVKTYVLSANRPNLHYEVHYMSPPEAERDVVQFLRTYNQRRAKDHPPGAGIIYCNSRDFTKAFASRLRDAGFGALAFHAEIPPSEKTSIMQRWQANDADAQIIVATITFGMGIDKPDVRFVIHLDLPKTLEACYQESGRAGRDNKAARCILYFSPESVRFNVSNEKVGSQMVSTIRSEGV